MMRRVVKWINNHPMTFGGVLGYLLGAVLVGELWALPLGVAIGGALGYLYKRKMK